MTTDLDRLRRIGWNATADVLAADPARTVDRARLLRRIARGKP